jgi:hypothetical protein
MTLRHLSRRSLAQILSQEAGSVAAAKHFAAVSRLTSTEGIRQPALAAFFSTGGKDTKPESKEFIGQGTESGSDSSQGGGFTPNTTAGPGAPSINPSTAAGGTVRPDFSADKSNDGHLPATEEPQRADTSGREPHQADPTSRRGFHTLARGFAGYGRGLHGSAAALTYQKPQDRPNTPSDQGTIQEPEAGSATDDHTHGMGPTQDPKEVENPANVTDERKLMERRRAKDPAYFDSVHGSVDEALKHVDTKSSRQDHLPKFGSTGNPDKSSRVAGMESNSEQGNKGGAEDRTGMYHTSAFLWADESAKEKVLGSESGSGNNINDSDASKLPGDAKRVQTTSGANDADMRPKDTGHHKESAHDAPVGNKKTDGNTAPEGMTGP